MLHTILIVLRYSAYGRYLPYNTVGRFNCGAARQSLALSLQRKKTKQSNWPNRCITKHLALTMASMLVAAEAAHAVAVTEGALLLSQILPIFSWRTEGDSNTSELLTTLTRFAEKQAILAPPKTLQHGFNREETVESPVLACLRDL